jgi:hypothetical protein
MAAENCLWGAPRIHGELLKLGIAVSERTVSRYLRGRPTTRPQTWRTFFANHFGGQTLISPLMFTDEHEKGVVDASDLPFHPAPSVDASCGSHSQGDRGLGCSLQASSLGVRLGQHHLQDCPGARKSSGRDPPRHLRLQRAPRRPRRFSFMHADSAFATDRQCQMNCCAKLRRAVMSLLRCAIES